MQVNSEINSHTVIAMDSSMAARRKIKRINPLKKIIATATHSGWIPAFCKQQRQKTSSVAMITANAAFRKIDFCMMLLF